MVLKIQIKIPFNKVAKIRSQFYLVSVLVLGIVYMPCYHLM